MKKGIVFKLMAVIALVVISLNLNSGLTAKAEESSVSVASTEEGTIVPFADVIVRIYRTYNGKLQYRSWNETRGYWVDPYWINC